MTAVAPLPPNLQNLSRSTWGSSNGTSNGYHSTMSADDVSRMLMPPRKTASRSSSSSSISSLASNSTAVAAPPQNPPAAAPTTNGDGVSRKRPTSSSRHLWPMSKSEPTAGISTSRAQTIASTSGPSAASAMNALHFPMNSNFSRDATLNSNTLNSRVAGQVNTGGENTTVLFLTPMNGTFERKTIQVPFYPDVIRIGRQTNAKTIPTAINGYFDSKVLSRQHAEVWADRNGKIWIRDIKSSNGTFVNGQRLSLENKDSDPHELRESDMLELGIDIVSEDQKTVVHHKVAARVEHAGFINNMDSFVITDPNEVGGQLNSQFAQNQNQLRRNSTPSSFTSGRGGIGTANNINVQRPQGFLLGPINMEQVIKKLNAEYRMARQQQLELQRSQQYLDTLLTGSQLQKQQESASVELSSSKGKSSGREFKTRFSDPPNPPPQAPLPEKPLDAAVSGLRRSDTERPKVPNGPLLASSKSDPQVASLSAALDSAKKDFEEQSKKLRDLQDLLVKERVRREDAEARASKLELAAFVNGSLSKPSKRNKDGEEQPTTPIEEEANSAIGQKLHVSNASESATTKLQRRLDLILAELQEVKESSEKWKREKEQAEKERDEERSEKKSLMEMIESMKQLERERLERQDKSRGSGRGRKTGDKKLDADASREIAASAEELASEDMDNGEAFIIQDSVTIPNVGSSRRKDFVANGHADTKLIRTNGKGAVAYVDRQQLMQAAPYLSAMSVVLLGVAVMTLVNRMTATER